ncbi:hypothetical protein [Amycolatopsis sp. NPDC051128]|uniref:hypothetical protein n=1 Tax=Amycolatopsis sp. NPDC051128 TaxID=3155412 RepID=UPI00341AAD86
MTALDDRPPTRTLVLPARNRWEWHLFEADGWAHLYRVADLANPRLDLLLPWCLLRAPFPLEHDRPSIDPRVMIPARGGTCQACAAHAWACIPHPRIGTPAVGEFFGDLFEVVTRDARA